MHSEAVVEAAPTGVIDFNTYLRSRDGKVQLENWLEERMKEELGMDDVSLFIDNPYSRISTKFDALSRSRQKEMLDYTRENIMVQKESLQSQLWTVMESVRVQEGALAAMEALLDNILLKEQVCAFSGSRV